MWIREVGMIILFKVDTQTENQQQEKYTYMTAASKEYEREKRKPFICVDIE